MQTSTLSSNNKVYTTVSVQDGPDLSIDVSPLLIIVAIIGGTVVIAIIIIIVLTVIGIKLFKPRRRHPVGWPNVK